MTEDTAFYKVNQPIMVWVKATALFGLPMLCSFVIGRWSMYQFPSLVLVLIAYYLNNVYPDRVLLEPEGMQVKFFLKNDWVSIPYRELRLAQEEHALRLVWENHSPMKLSMKHLSVLLYNQLSEKIQRAE